MKYKSYQPEAKELISIRSLLNFKMKTQPYKSHQSTKAHSNTQHSQNLFRENKESD